MIMTLVLEEIFQAGADIVQEHIRRAKLATKAGDAEAAKQHTVAAAAVAQYMHKCHGLTKAAARRDGPDLVAYVSEMSSADPSGAWIQEGAHGSSSGA